MKSKKHRQGNLLEDFADIGEIADFESSAVVHDDKFYINRNPFDFFRKPLPEEQYVPKTQVGLRRAFSGGIIGIEHFLALATSLRPLSDEAQDIDEITRLFSQQKLASRPNLHSVRILRRMISDPNPEIALYAAEGLNSIENSFINAINTVKDAGVHKRGRAFFEYCLTIIDPTMEKKVPDPASDTQDPLTQINPDDIQFIFSICHIGTDRIKSLLVEIHDPDYFYDYLLARLYLEFSKLLEGQQLIKNFYLKESFQAIKNAYVKNKNIEIKRAAGETYMGLQQFEKAISIFVNIYTENKGDINALFSMAECYFNLHNFQKVEQICRLISKRGAELESLQESLLYQWII